MATPTSDEADVFCAEASLQAGEPLAGTAAARISRWLVLEQPGAWGPKGVEDSGLEPELVAYLRALGSAFPGLRVQLARRHERGAEAGTRIFLARSDETAGTLHQLRLPERSALPRVGLEAWLEHDVVPDGAEVLREPIYLVCAHGKRDRCCALRGMPLYSALRELAPDRVWQTTHLGGHRFAATMVVLPHGICYGRLSEADAQGLYTAHEARALHELGKVRGRSCYDGAAQAAEVLLRERLGERRLEAFRLIGVEAGGLAREQNVGSAEKIHRVRFAELVGSREHVIELERVTVPPAPASCGAKPKPGEGFVQLRVPG